MGGPWGWVNAERLKIRNRKSKIRNEFEIRNSKAEECDGNNEIHPTLKR